MPKKKTKKKIAVKDIGTRKPVSKEEMKKVKGGFSPKKPVFQTKKSCGCAGTAKKGDVAQLED